MNNNAPVLSTERIGALIGSMWDSGVQELVFTRPEELDALDMRLLFRPGYDAWVEIDLGTGNAYTLTNALTQRDTLTLQCAFLEGETVRCGTNAVVFRFRSCPQGGAVPEDIKSDYSALLSEAVTGGAVVEGSYEFYNRTGDKRFTLPASSGGAGGTVSVNAGATATGDAGTAASVTNAGTEQDVVLDFVIPRGATGAQGEKGATGEQGPQGIQGEPGADGADGYTPVRGVDYWTPDDLDDMVAQVTANFTDGNEVAY